jgi:hypothetical protein
MRKALLATLSPIPPERSSLFPLTAGRVTPARFLLAKPLQKAGRL